MANISFLGLGNMGFGMASQLLKRGHRLNLYNRTASRADSLVRQGARLYPTPGEACQGASVILSMVANDQASESIWCASDGVLNANVAQNALAIECSTLSRQWVLDLSARCQARGLRYIDAPVTGLPDAAMSGELTLLVGAAEQDLAAALPILGDLSSKVLRFGAVGAGTAYKLIINLLGAVQIASAAEAVAMAERARLDLALVANAISSSQAASPQVVRNVRRMIADDHSKDIVFSSALRYKDVQYAMQFAREMHARVPFGSVADGIYSELCASGFSEVNESSVIEILRDNRGSFTE
jgi:3-hydroxyisobutyrate dehydrogenase